MTPVQDYNHGMSTSFPLITLQPVADKRNAWVAMLLEPALPPTANDLGLTFGDFGLAEALGGLPCVLMLADLAAGIEALPDPAATVVCLPADYCCDRGHDENLQALRAAGYRLMAAGLPPAGQTLFAGVEQLALPCPGREMPSGDRAALTRLPGPHMALNAGRITCPGRCHFGWLAGHLPQTACDQTAKAAEAPNRMLLLELLSQVVNDADSRAIEATVKRDPQLSYHLLKLVNSVALSPRAKIASFNQAIALLGRRQLQRWLQLLLYARTQQDGMANLFLPQAAMRAGLAEALSARAGGNREAQDRAFMVGMFSLLDRVFGMPLADIVRPLNLAEDVTQALTEGSGPLGVLLRAVLAGEAPPGADLAAVLDEAGISHEGWGRSVIHACAWAVQVSREA